MTIAALLVVLLMCAGLAAVIVAIRQACAGRSAPPWWLRFERDFAEYVAARPGRPTSV